MKFDHNHWGAIITDNNQPYSLDIHINFTAEIAESRVYIERLFREYKQGDKDRMLRYLRNVDWTLSKIQK